MEPGLQNYFTDGNAIAQGLHFLGEKFGATLGIDSKEIGHMKKESLEGHVPVVPDINCGNFRPVGRIEQREQRHFLPLRAKLLRDLIRDVPPETITPAQVRAAGLPPPDLFHVKGGHVFDFGQRCRAAIQSLRLQTIEGLIVTEEFGKLAVNQNIPAGPLNKKEGEPRAVGLNGYKRRPARRSEISTQNRS